jgi:hypothetical protein
MSPAAGRRARAFGVLAPIIVAAVLLLLHGPIPQDPDYHRFADQRVLLGIPHAGDVLSNVAFLLAGVPGLALLWRTPLAGVFASRAERMCYLLFFAGVSLTAFGSAYYHFAPDSRRLFWDRLPMTVAFLSLLSAVMTERVSARLSSRLLWLLLSFGAASVLYWRLTEEAGKGDLRPYALVQYGSALLIALLLLLSPPRYTHAGLFWAAAGAYALAMLCELLDAPIFRITGVVSGHNLKHIFAALSPGLVLYMLRRRRPIDSPARS